MKERFHGTFGGQFKDGKDYKSISYHIEEIRKCLQSFSFTVTVESAPADVFVRTEKGLQRVKRATK